jgi:Zn-finger nucleic acid-binding protein
VSRVIEQSCPWCEARFKVELRAVTDDESETCPECLTTWVFEEEPAYELALAA